MCRSMKLNFCLTNNKTRWTGISLPVHCLLQPSSRFICCSPVAALLARASWCLQQAPNTCPRPRWGAGDDIHLLRPCNSVGYSVAVLCSESVAVLCSACGNITTGRLAAAGESQLVRHPDGHSSAWLLKIPKKWAGHFGIKLYLKS